MIWFKKRPKKEHKFYLQVMRSKTFNRNNNLFSTYYSLKITTLLCSCAFCFKYPANWTRSSSFFWATLFNLYCNTRTTHCILGNLIKNSRGRAPFQNSFKVSHQACMPRHLGFRLEEMIVLSYRAFIPQISISGNFQCGWPP